MQTVGAPAPGWARSGWARSLAFGLVFALALPRALQVLVNVAADPLRKLDNIVLTPHLGYSIEESLLNFYGDTVEAPVTCRLDTAEEVSIYDAGGVLQRFAQDFLQAGQAA